MAGRRAADSRGDALSGRADPEGTPATRWPGRRALEAFPDASFALKDRVGAGRGRSAAQLAYAGGYSQGQGGRVLLPGAALSRHGRTGRTLQEGGHALHFVRRRASFFAADSDGSVRLPLASRAPSPLRAPASIREGCPDTREL